jgi:hypothetical protein
MQAGGTGAFNFILTNTEYQNATSASYNTAVVAGYTSVGATIGLTTIETQAAAGGSPILRPNRRVFTRRKRPDFTGWVPLSDRRTRSSLLVPERILILPSRKAA